MTLVRGAALGALLLVVAVLAIVLLSGGGGTEYQLVFQTAGQLVKGDTVRVGGTTIGTVKDISLTNDNQARITISVNSSYGALHEGTTAVVRLTSLSGVANRYVSVTPGPNNAPKLAAGATLGTDSNTSVVDLDQLFNTFDPKTRKGLQNVIQGSAAQYAGKTQEVNAAAKEFNPALSTTSQLMNELTRDQNLLTQAVVSTSQVMTTVAARREDLSALVTHLNRTMGSIANQNASLSQGLGVLPDTLREGNSTFRDLRSALDDLDLLVNASKPATKNLASFFERLRPLIYQAVPAFQLLSQLVHRPGPANDLTDAVRQLPTLQRTASPIFTRAIKTMKQGQTDVDFFRPYAPDLVAWISSFGASAANYDANGHYLRLSPVFGAFRYQQNGDGSATLQGVPPSERLKGLDTGNLTRCPGGATQARPDGSNPYVPAGEDCNPKETLPGP